MYKHSRIIEGLSDKNNAKSKQVKSNIKLTEKLLKEINTTLNAKIKDINQSIDFDEDVSKKAGKLDDLNMALDNIVGLVKNL